MLVPQLPMSVLHFIMLVPYINNVRILTEFYNVSAAFKNACAAFNNASATY